MGAERVWQIFLFLIIALASNFDYGFSTTYLNTPVDQFRDYLNRSYQHNGHVLTEEKYNVLWNLILNISFVGFFIGIWLNPLLNDRHGRKTGFLVGNFFALVGAISRLLAIIFLAPWALLLGRFTTSIFTAVTYQSCILCLQECAPTQLRGLITFLSEITFSGMCLVGMLLGNKQLLGDHLVALVGVMVPPCAFFFAVLFLFHETPKYLLIVRKDYKKAVKSVHFYHGRHVDADQVLKEISLEAECQEQSIEPWTAVKDILFKQHLRKALIISCTALQNCVAFWSLLLSSTYFLTQTNLAENVATWSSTAMTLAYVVGTITGTALIEKVGRRGLLLTFTILNNLTLIIFVICSELQPVLDPLKYGCMAMLIAYGYTYGSGVGAISWFISSELVPQQYRGLTQSISYAVNTISVIITTFSVLPLYNAIGSYAFLILYSTPSAFCIIYLYRNLPETKGKEIHEVVARLMGKFVITEFDHL